MPDAWLPDRRRLRPVPLRAVLEAMQRDEHVLTVVVGQPLTAVARALYAGGAILVECDADQNPVAAYRRALTWAPSGDNLVAWGCWICGEEFTLRGCAPASGLLPSHGGQPRTSISNRRPAPGARRFVQNVASFRPLVDGDGGGCARVTHKAMWHRRRCVG